MAQDVDNSRHDCRTRREHKETSVIGEHGGKERVQLCSHGRKLSSGTTMPRRSTVQHTIPQNPLFVAFPKTDGDKARWPRNTMEVVGNDGQVNYMVPHEEDSSLAIKYRVEVAIALKNYYKWTGELLWDFFLQILEHCRGGKLRSRIVAQGLQDFRASEGLEG